MKVNEGLLREVMAFLLIGLAVGAVMVLVGCSPGSTSAPSLAGAPMQAPVKSSVMAEDASSSLSRGALAPPEERKGLGTGWGSEMKSALGNTSFDRASDRPYGEVDMIYYNDSRGVEAMAGQWKNETAPLQGAARGAVEWGVKSGWSWSDHYMAGGKRFVVGKKGKNYAVEIRNLTSSRLEVVLSVDGLDVMDGQSASFKKRGYIIGPHEKLEVKGFRKSYDKVAAFEFSTVSGSYSNLRHGVARDVGVIGLAVFAEKGREPWVGAARQRANARPFAEAPMRTVR